MALYFVTGNKDKIREAEEILGMKLLSVMLDLDEIQGMDSEKIAEHKVMQAFYKIKKPVFVSDQSLYMSSLNGFPGPLVKWFWSAITLERICDIARYFKDNKIQAKTTIAYYDGKALKIFSATTKGTIPFKPRGKNGFAWDPIFIPDGHTKTFAEMSPEEKNSVSMHRPALEKFRKFLLLRN